MKCAYFWRNGSTPDANHEALHVWVNKASSSVKQKRGSQEAQRENAEIPQGRSQLLEESDPHPQRAGSCRSPASHPCTKSSEQGPGIPTPPERTLCTHQRMSMIPEMKIYFTKGLWGEFLFSWKMRRGERDKDQFSCSMYSDRSMRRDLEQNVCL